MKTVIYLLIFIHETEREREQICHLNKWRREYYIFWGFLVVVFFKKKICFYRSLNFKASELFTSTLVTCLLKNKPWGKT